MRKMPSEKPEIADAVHDERFVGGIGGEFLL